MKLSGTIELYAGGPGSGRHPEGGPHKEMHEKLMSAGFKFDRISNRGFGAGSYTPRPTGIYNHPSTGMSVYTRKNGDWTGFGGGKSHMYEWEL